MRLIKSEFFNGYQFGSEYYECFKNPTFDEWHEMLDKSKYKGARGIIEQDGTVYIWNENILHEKALSVFGIPDGIHFNRETAGIYIYITPNINMNILKESFEKASALYNHLGKNCPIIGINTTWYSSDTDPYYKEIEKISDILKYEPARELVTMKNISRLKKLTSNKKPL